MLVFGGSAYSYANDPEFMPVSTSERFWQQVIDKFYKKYEGIKLLHEKWLRDVGKTGMLVTPTGREFQFDLITSSRGARLPETTIKNYPIQSLGHDMMTVLRVSFRTRLKAANLQALLVNTIHDSIVVDCPKEEVQIVVNMFYQLFRDFNVNFLRTFGVEYNIPLFCECSYGPNMRDMVTIGEKI